ncbi:MAG: TAT-variant-translocated molybdopterin oxidoreductase [Silvanigrellaceae bacterium]|nr:TAT-variant-translocated molybdopterin oxidoreductase [Silvanigrellaceae bacterium]
MANLSDEKYWRSLNDLADNPEFIEKMHREFPQGATELEMRPGVERRRFLNLLGASLALAGVASTGCIRRPEKHIYPDVHSLENRMPGTSEYYATSALIGGSVVGLLATSIDGRPTRLDGSARHPMTNPLKEGSSSVGLGGSNPWIQGEILNLYDPERGQHCYHLNKKVSLDNAQKELASLLQNAKSTNGAKLALVFEGQSSPSFAKLMNEFKSQYSDVTLVEIDPTYSSNLKKGIELVTGHSSVQPVYHLKNAEIIFSLDSDFLGVEGDSVKNAKEFAEKRRVKSNKDTMNRLYCVESSFSLTGASADHRYSLKSSLHAEVMLTLIRELAVLGVSLPIELSKTLTPKVSLDDRLLHWVRALAKDLVSKKERSLVIVGNRQPAWLHSVALALNSSLGNIGKTLSLIPNSSSISNNSTLSIEALKEKIENKSIQSLIIIGHNLVYSSPADLEYAELLTKVENSVYLGYRRDETALLCKLYFPKTHFLEDWGDLRASDGTISLRQPLIMPLFDECVSEIGFLLLLNKNQISSFDYVKSYWQNECKKQGVPFLWEKSLSEGLLLEWKPSERAIDSNFNWTSIQSAYKNARETVSLETDGLCIEFALDKKVYDGRYSNNAWLQELSDPIHKLVWDNALLISPSTAKKLGLKARPNPGESEVDLVQIEYKKKSMNAAVWEMAGIAEDTLVLHLGYGKSIGAVEQGTGFNANLIRHSRTPWFDQGVRLTKTGKTYRLVSTQEHWVMDGDSVGNRPAVVREATLDSYKGDPQFVLKSELLPRSKQKDLLFEPPLDPMYKKTAEQQWGMVIDLNTCIGCNACTIACQSENNISVVGKEEVFKNREMSWIRMDRYFRGDIDNPEVQAVFQPLGCVHCETAPCESVCPVAATVHSPDGINQMAYNRCVGTRYCANNCPYKVRRFNFFNYSKTNDENNPLYAMQKNPNVTVRFRGVMEKCTYCVQRINHAKITAKKQDRKVRDGEITTACQNACPTDAIVFGDVADPLSKVSQLKSQDRNYSLLGELNTRPRTTYLAKLRNTNLEIKGG